MKPPCVVDIDDGLEKKKSTTTSNPHHIKRRRQVKVMYFSAFSLAIVFGDREIAFVCQMWSFGPRCTHTIDQRLAHVSGCICVSVSVYLFMFGWILPRIYILFLSNPLLFMISVSLVFCFAFELRVQSG